MKHDDVLKFEHGTYRLTKNVEQGRTTRKTLVDELKACSKTKNLTKGKELHAEAIKSGNDSWPFVVTALINMYAKCGKMVDAREVFDNIEKPGIVSWNTIMLGYADNGQGSIALDLYANMKSQNCAPDCVTFLAALKACAAIALEQDESGKAKCLERGRLLHSEIRERQDIYVQSTLIDMYAKCGSMVEARQVFDEMNYRNSVSWNALISGYADNEQGFIALEMYARMKNEGYAPDRITFAAALKACISLADEQDGNGKTEALARGRKIHFEIRRTSDPQVQSRLVYMYAKCGSMLEARQVFDGIKQPDVVSWTTLIMGYAENGEPASSLKLYAKMRSQGCLPDSVILIAVLKSCGLLGALTYGRKIHAEMDAQSESKAVSALVDFYAKCGNLVQAHKVFDMHPESRELRTWTALLGGYSTLGDDKTVFSLFQEMLDAGFKPNGATLLCILTCCSHAGLVERAQGFFDAMVPIYGVTPTVEHYNCMADMLGRFNKMDDAIALLRSMSCRADSVTWLTVLGACNKWRNSEVGWLAFMSLVYLNGKNSSTYLLMAHIYESKGMWKEQRLRAFPVTSCWTNGGGETHVFSV